MTSGLQVGSKIKLFLHIKFRNFLGKLQILCCKKSFDFVQNRIIFSSKTIPLMSCTAPRPGISAGCLYAGELARHGQPCTWSQYLPALRTVAFEYQTPANGSPPHLSEHQVIESLSLFLSLGLKTHPSDLGPNRLSK